MSKTNCNCDFCGKAIFKRPSQLKKYKKHYCDVKCSSSDRAKRMTKNCEVCGVEVTRKPSEFSDKTYCSRECYHKVLNKPKTSSKVQVTCDYCGVTYKRYKSELKGKKLSFCSNECRHKGTGLYLSGENHHRWNKDLTDEDRQKRRKTPSYRKWRDSVYRRDLYECQCCGDNKGGNLVAHHILNFSEHINIQLDVNNGITLCEECHKGFHDTFGYTKNDEEQLKYFIKGMPINYQSQ